MRADPCSSRVDREVSTRDEGRVSKKTTPLIRTLKRAALPAAGLVLMAFFGGYAVLGPNGVLAYGDYQRQLAKRERDYAALDQRRAVLRNRVMLLDPDHANPDMVDEMTRKELNVVHPDEVVVPLKR
jgi:cell division protein FtsB